MTARTIRRSALWIPVVALLCGPSRAEERVLRVPAQHATIAAALAAAADGDVVLVADGVRSSPIVVSRPVTLRAEPEAKVTIAAEKDRRCVEVKGARGVTLEGLRLEGGQVGLSASGAVDLFVRRCEVAGFARQGILLHGCGATLQECRVSGPGADSAPGVTLGIGVDAGSAVILLDCTVDGGAAVGVWVDRGSLATLQRCTIRGARRSGDLGGVGILVRRSSRAMLAENLVEDNEAAGIQVAGSDVVSRGDRLVGNRGAGILANGGAHVEVHDAHIAKTGAGSVPSGGTAIWATLRSRVRLHGVRAEDGDGFGIRVVSGARVEAASCTLARNGSGGIRVDAGSSLDAKRCDLDGNVRHGVLVVDGARANLEDVTVRGTRRAGEIGRGVEVSGKARLWARRFLVADSEEMGVVVLDGGFLDLAEGRLERNGKRGVTVERGSRARIRHVAITAQQGPAVGVHGSEASLLDSTLEVAEGIAVDVSGGRLVAAGNRYVAERSKAGALAPTPTLTLRKDGGAPLPGVVLARRVPDGPAYRLDVENARVPVEPGRYELVVADEGPVFGETPWGTVEVTDAEVVVPLTSGIELEPAAAFPLRIRARAGGFVAGVRSHAERVALPAGRYDVLRVHPNGVESPLTPADGVVVEAGRRASVPVPAEPCCDAKLLSIEALESGATGTPLRVRVEAAPDAPAEVQGRLVLVGVPGGAQVVLGPGPLSEIVGERDVPLPNGGNAGVFVVAVEALHGEEVVARAETLVLRSPTPRLLLAAPRYANPGEPFRLALASSGPSSAQGDVYVATVAEGERHWLVERGDGERVLVPDAEKAPLHRGAADVSGLRELYRGRVPRELAGKGRFHVEATVVDVVSGETRATSRVAVESLASPVPLRGTLLVGDAPLRLGEGESAVATATRRGSDRRWRRSAPVSADGSFSFGDVPAGQYALEATWTDAAGGLHTGNPLALDVGAGGISDATPAVTAEPIATLSSPASGPGGGGNDVPPAGPSSAPASPKSAQPAPEGAGGCGEREPGADPCPCGKLPVCVFGESPHLPGKADVDDPATVQRWARWWLPRKVEIGLSLATEQAVARALEAADPCIEAIPVQSRIIERLGRMLERADALREDVNKVLQMEDMDRAMEEYPEVIRLFSDLIFDLMSLDEQDEQCVVRVTLDGKIHANSLDVTYRVDSPGLPSRIENPSDIAMEEGDIVSRENVPDAVPPVTAEGRASSLPDDVGARVADALGPELSRLRRALFCDCAETSTHCVVTQFADHIRPPGVFTQNVCTSTLTCCGRFVIRWQTDVIAPGTSGLFGGSTEWERTCCGRWEEEFPRGPDDDASSDPIFCSSGYGRRALDLDCDGLPNSEDPTPFGDDGPFAPKK